MQIADGAVAGVERGSLKGGISEVNPDALPITVVAYSPRRPDRPRRRRRQDGR